MFCMRDFGTIILLVSVYKVKHIDKLKMATRNIRDLFIEKQVDLFPFIVSCVHNIRTRMTIRFYVASIIVHIPFH
jgi:hypothetical protein